jgi:hypothetical protein
MTTDTFKTTDKFKTFHLAYMKTIEFFYPGVFVELMRLNYGIDYYNHDW